MANSTVNTINMISPLSVPSLIIDGDGKEISIKMNGKTYIAIEHNGELRFINETKRKLWEINKTLEKL